MAKATSSKKILAAVVLSCLCAVAIAVPSAYSLWYVWDETDLAEESYGAMEICFTLDETAVGGAVTAGQFFISDGNATVEGVLNNMIKDSNNQQGIEAIHDYDYTSIGEYLEAQGYEYTIECYRAASQEPGTHETEDSDSVGGEEVILERFDRVVITVTGYAE